MPTFDILRESVPAASFRVDAVRAMFDLQTDSIRERFSGRLDIEDRPWSIGIIYGASGTGKSTIARELFPEQYILGYKYGAGSIIDDMPQNCDVKTIAATFNAVGFSSPPSWLKSYSVLSNGEKMRADLARALLESRDMIVFDEFTSVVNREVAKIGSAAVQKAVRRMGRRFIAVSCHDDIIPWLEPDWVYCANDGSFFLSNAGEGRISNSASDERKERNGKYSVVITI